MPETQPTNVQQLTNETQSRSIQQLTTATDFIDSDFLVISSSVSGNDRKIARQDFVAGVGNPNISGFTAISDTVDDFTLTPVQGVAPEDYFDGMTVKFIGTADSTGAVRIRIVGGLPYKNLFLLGTAITAEILDGEYYEAVYIGDSATGNFFQTNLENIQTPVASGYVATADATNDFTLTPSEGAPVTEYAPGMTVSFVAPSTSNGTLQVRIDGGLDYRNMFLLGTTTTSTLVAGQYYEAVYIGDALTGNFFQTNLVADPLPTVTGYVGSSTVNDEVTLDPSNGILPNQYYPDMVVEFTSPISSTGAPMVKINGLPAKNFYKFGTVSDAAPFFAGEHYRATYDQNADAFYQTNLQEATIFTNEYGAVGTVANDEQSTTYVLTSAIGVPAESYYNNMSLLFTVDIASKGTVFVNVDGLGDQVLGDDDDDFIANDLYPGQLILAMYNGTKFIKHRFATTNPPAPPIDPDLPIPPENQVTINVGINEPIKSVREAITVLIEEYGTDGGNRLATIVLKTGAEGGSYSFSHDANWITIDTDGQFVISNTNPSATAIRFLTWSMTGDYRTPVISGSWAFNDSVHLISPDSIGSHKLRNCTLEQLTGQGASPVDFFRSSNQTGLLKITLDNVQSNLNRFPIRTYQRDREELIKIKNSNINVLGAGFQPLGFGLIIVEDSSITASGLSGFMSIGNHEFNATNSTLQNTTGICVRINFGSKANFQNVRVAAPTGFTSIIFTSGATGLLDGGDYRTSNGLTENTNIFAQGEGTIVRLLNSPLGGTSTSNGGQIITI